MSLIDQVARDAATKADTDAARANERVDTILLSFDRYRDDNTKQHARVVDAVDGLAKSSKEGVTEMRKLLREDYVSKDRFALIEKVGYSLVALLISGVAAQIFTAISKAP
jgi:hypothetical protein